MDRPTDPRATSWVRSARDPVHQRCQAAHACAPKRARLAALEASVRARIRTYRVVLMLQVDHVLGSPASWNWSSRLGLRPPENVVAEVERVRVETGERAGL